MSVTSSVGAQWAAQTIKTSVWRSIYHHYTYHHTVVVWSILKSTVVFILRICFFGEVSFYFVLYLEMEIIIVIKLLFVCLSVIDPIFRNVQLIQTSTNFFQATLRHFSTQRLGQFMSTIAVNHYDVWVSQHKKERGTTSWLGYIQTWIWYLFSHLIIGRKA